MMAVFRYLLGLPVYVCVCNGVTERDIRQAAAGGCRSMTELTMRTGCGATCGSCVPMACELLDEIQRETATQAHGNVVTFRHARNAA
jgi:bacterioferritin-associated ferredoxin